MRHVLERAITLCTTAVLALAGVSQAMAQAYPNKPIRFVLGFPPGTYLDGSARVFGDEMSKRLGQPIVLEFKPGAGGSIGARTVVTADPDGYTLFWGPSAPIHPVLMKANSVDVTKEMAPISNVIAVPWFLLTRVGGPGATMKELIEQSKAATKKMLYGSSIPQMPLGIAMLKNRTGLDLDVVPYKSATQILVALLSGEIDVAFGSLTTYLPQVQAGKLRILFVAAARRSPVVSNVPTAAELGIANFQVEANVGLWAPLATSKDILTRLTSVSRASAKAPLVIERFHSYTGEAIGSSAEEQLQTHYREMSFWSDAAKSLNYQPE